MQTEKREGDEWKGGGRRMRVKRQMVRDTHTINKLLRVWSNLKDRIIINVDDSVQVSGDNFCHFVQILEVVLAIADEAVESNGGKIAHGHLIRGRVLHYLCAQVARLNCTKVLSRQKETRG